MTFNSSVSYDYEVVILLPSSPIVVWQCDSAELECDRDVIDATPLGNYITPLRGVVGVGLVMAEGSTTDRLQTAASLIGYHVEPRELKGFVWDVREWLRHSD